MHGLPSGLNEPTSQSVHAAEPAAAERPAAQSAQSLGVLVEPVAALNLPAVQPAAHVADAALAAKRPPGHAAHAPEAVVCPAGQASQVVPEDGVS